MVGFFLHVCARDCGEHFFFIPRSEHFGALALGTLARNKLPSFMAIMFPQDSVRNRDRESCLGLHHRNLVVFRHMMRREKVCFL